MRADFILPGTGSTETPVSLTVMYPSTNGCDFVERFDESRNNGVVTVKALTKPVPKEAVCTQDVGFRSIECTFTASAAGNYELRFLKTDGSFMTHRLIIQ